MQNRFTSGGHVEENIQGGLVAQIESFLPQETPQPKKIPVVKDPAKQAALRKHFGPLTRKRSQWKPDRLLCIRFNVPNPFPRSVYLFYFNVKIILSIKCYFPFFSAGDAQDSSKFVAKGTSGSKFSIFDVLNAVPQAGPSFMSSGYENIPSGPVQGPANKVQELEWDKAEKGELEEKAEPDLVPDEVGPSEEIKEETQAMEVYERPSMDIFKAIFADSDSEDEEEEEKKEEEDQKAENVETTKKSEQPKPPVVEDIDDDTYGPRLPVSSSANKVAVVSLAASQESSNQVEWVERHKAEKKKKDKKDKKKKKNKKKDKKNKKRKRRHSDVSSSSSDEEVDDIKILQKIVALKKMQKL